MIAFEITVNGEKLCTAGVSNKGVLHAIVNGPEHPHLSVGGLFDGEHVEWLKPRLEVFELKIGDEVTIRIAETDLVDEPLDRSVSQTRAEMEREITGCLEEARSLLPASIRESESASLAIFDERMAQNHLMGATDVLGALGDLNAVSAPFWEALANAAFHQSAYEDCGRYQELEKAAKQSAKI